MSAFILQLNNCAFSLPGQIILNAFTGHVQSGERLGLIGNNGSGKTTLLNLCAGQLTPTQGQVIFNGETRACIPQFIYSDHHSGGEAFMNALNVKVAKQPDLLLLDEPTNHLDSFHREKLRQILRRFSGALITASHDGAFLNEFADKLWHIHDHQVKEINCGYNQHIQEQNILFQNMTHSMRRLRQAEQEVHLNRMQEQERAARSRSTGIKNTIKRKWDKCGAHTKRSHAQESLGQKQSSLNSQRKEIQDQIKFLNYREPMKPRFIIPTYFKKQGCLISVTGGSIFYSKQPVLELLHFNLNAKEKAVIRGRNGSGKTTFLKALNRSADLITEGDWHIPKRETIGYLDQHICIANPDLTLRNYFSAIHPLWDDNETHKHLSPFLIQGPGILDRRFSGFSGGEKNRIILAGIAAKTPSLLLLDEVTNNLDIINKTYMTEVLNEYPGAYILISHDDEFINTLKVDSFYEVSEKRLRKV